MKCECEYKCECAIFELNNIKYYIQCEKCKKYKKEIGISYNSNITNTSKSEYKWYEQHIILVRDNPDFRLGLNLFCLFGYGLISTICYLHYFDIINYKNVIQLNIVFGIFLLFYMIIVFAYIDATDKLRKNSKYKL